MQSEDVGGVGAGSNQAQVRPSLFVRAAVRPMTKVLNPLVLRLAGRRHAGMAAKIFHVGRRSGHVYATPVAAKLVGDSFVATLTFGNVSDWSRNVMAAGRASIRFDGRDYEAVAPEVVDWEQARPLVRSAFNPLVRFFFRIIGIRQFMRLRVEGNQVVNKPSLQDERRERG